MPWDPTPAGVDRVGLESGRPALACVLDDSSKRCVTQSKPPVSDTDGETEDRPDLHLVDLRDRARPDQTAHLVTLPEAAPSNRSVLDVGEHARCRCDRRLGTEQSATGAVTAATEHGQHIREALSGCRPNVTPATTFGTARARKP